MHIGKKIKDLIAIRKMSVVDFASHMNLSAATVYNIFEKEDINTQNLRKISTVLNVPITYWFEDMPPPVNVTGANEHKEVYGGVQKDMLLQRENEMLKEQIALLKENAQILKNSLELYKKILKEKQ